MFAANQARTDRSIGRVLKNLGGAFLEPLALVGNWLGICNVVRWLQDEAQHDATMRELNPLNDYCLDDMGIKRSFDLRTDDLVRRLRAGG